jgi:CRP-like cAMP-binding protein
MSILRHYLATFHDFSAQEWQQIETAFVLKTYPKGEFLLQPGQVDRYIWFLERGVLRVFEEIEDGGEQTFYFVSTGQFAADIESFTEQRGSVVSLQAVTSCQILTISYDSFQQLAQQVPVWSKTIQRIVEKALLEKVQKRSRLLYEDARTRYQRLVVEQPEVAQQAPLGMIASYLGITLSSLSRLRKQLAIEHA